MLMFMVVSPRPKPLWEFTRFIWWMQTERWVATNPQTKPTDLGCESADKRLLPSTSTIAICYYYSARKLTEVLNSFYHLMKGGTMSWPRHCSKGVQPVPKAVLSQWLSWQTQVPTASHTAAVHATTATCGGRWAWTTCLKLLLDCTAAGNRTHNHRVASPTP